MLFCLVSTVLTAFCSLDIASGRPVRWQVVSGCAMSAQGVAGRRQALRAELASIRAEERTLHARARAEARWWVLSDTMRHVCLILFDLAEYDAEPAVVYLRGVAAQRDWPTRDNDDLRGMVHDLFLEATATPEGLQCYAALTDTSNPTELGAMQQATNRIVEWRAVVWTRSVNTRVGLGPSSSSLLDRCEAARVELAGPAQPRRRGGQLDGTNRRFVHRIRERYRGRYGKFKVRERIPRSEMRAKSTASWQWFNYLESRAAEEGKTLLRINLDETSVCVHQGGLSGNVFVSKRTRGPELVESVPASTRRKYMTYVAVICDRSDLQPHLPQYLIGNEATLLQRDLAKLRALCPPNVKLLRRKSAWCDAALCAWIVRDIAAALAPHRAGLQPVFVLDAARIHLTDALRACRGCNMWPLVVAAKMTWMLQPLDTDAFALFKFVLGANCQKSRIASADGALGMEALVRALVDAVRKVLQGHRWSSAFDRNGFGHRQALVCERVLRELETPVVVGASSARPTDEQVRLCFPRRQISMPMAALFGPAGGVRSRVAAARPLAIGGMLVVPRAAAAAGAPAAHCYGRTRSGASFKPSCGA